MNYRSNRRPVPFRYANSNSTGIALKFLGAVVIIGLAIWFAIWFAISQAGGDKQDINKWAAENIVKVVSVESTLA